MASVPCLLTPVPNEINNFTAKAGTLSLILSDVAGNTSLDTLDSSVFDITTPGAQVAVTVAATTSSISFQLVAGKKYYLSLTFCQLVSPFSAKANLKEGCGQLIDTISAVNLYPGYIIQGVV
jgi:hypothetical protein